MTIYLDCNSKGKGYGKILYSALEEELQKMGYTKVGDFHKCGNKFGRWYNMIWMEKIIGEH